MFLELEHVLKCVLEWEYFEGTERRLLRISPISISYLTGSLPRFCGIDLNFAMSSSKGDGRGSEEHANCVCVCWQNRQIIPCGGLMVRRNYAAECVGGLGGGLVPVVGSSFERIGIERGEGEGSETKWIWNHSVGMLAATTTKTTTTTHIISTQPVEIRWNVVWLTTMLIECVCMSGNPFVSTRDLVWGKSAS